MTSNNVAMEDSVGKIAATKPVLVPSSSGSTTAADAPITAPTTAASSSSLKTPTKMPTEVGVEPAKSVGAIASGSSAVYVDAENVSRKVVIKSFQGDGYYQVNIGVGAATISVHESKLTAVGNIPSASSKMSEGSNIDLLPSLDSVGTLGSELEAKLAIAPHTPARTGISNDNSSCSNIGAGPDLDLLLALKSALGTELKLKPSILPDPKFKQDYHLKFGISRQFWFEQIDHGVKFEPFLGLDFVANPETVSSCPSACENFRCMFLHLGVGIMVHPFVLQAKFRLAAERLLSLPDDNLVKALFSEQLVSVVMQDSYVEMDVLHAIWPLELNGYRVMLVSFEEVGQKGFYGFKSIVTYTPDTGPFDAEKNWIGVDVILTLKDGHFTLLKPMYGDPRNSKPWSDHPVDDLMTAIEEYNTEYKSQSVCLQPYVIGEHLHPDGVITI